MAEMIMAFTPLVFLIVYALKTRKMAESMILATLLAMVLLHRQHFLTGTIDAMYATLANASYQFALCVIIGFGGMITLLQASGALMGFRDLLARVASTPQRTLLLAWILSVVMFVDEYLNALTVTISMRGICDKNRIPREHLAVQANIMACCLCVTVPFTSWTAFSVGLISDFDLGFNDYLQAIPFMFYPLAMMLLSLLLALGVFPKVGGLKQAYQRVQSGGAPFEQNASAEKLVDIADVDESNVSSAWNAIIPLAALVGGTVLFDNDLLHGIIIALIVQFLLYVISKRMTVGEYFDHFFAGAKGLTSIGVKAFYFCEALEGDLTADLGGVCVVVGHIDEIDLLVLDLGNDGGHVIIGDSNVVFGNDLRAKLGSLRLEVGGLLLAEVEINGNDGNTVCLQLADSKLRGSGSLDRTGEGLGEDEVACIDNVRVNSIGGDHYDTGILADGSGDLGGTGVGTGYDSVNIIHGSKLFQNVGRFRRIQTVIDMIFHDLLIVALRDLTENEPLRLTDRPGQSQMAPCDPLQKLFICILDICDQCVRTPFIFLPVFSP